MCLGFSPRGAPGVLRWLDTWDLLIQFTVSEKIKNAAGTPSGRVDVPLQARKKCLPFGKTVTSDVHNWDPDTTRDTEKKSERKQKGLKGGGGKLREV